MRHTDVYAEIAAERAAQDAQWGGPAHDDEHGVDDWREYRRKYEHRMALAKMEGQPFDAGWWLHETRRSLIKLAALAVAQIESLDRLHPARPTPSDRETR